MRGNTIGAASTLIISAAAGVHASAAAEKPVFQASHVQAPFVEQFTPDWTSRWIVSQATKQTPVGDEIMSYVGQWSVEEPEVVKGIEGDAGLVMKSKAAHHAISAVFLEPISVVGTNAEEPARVPLVVQYEVKTQKGLECGGAYLKLLTENPGEGLRAGEDFTDKTPFTIMFGPDKCGATNKVHFIFRHKNPKTGEYEEKHLINPPVPKIGKHTALYTLIVNPDNTYEIKINDESVKSGSLLEDFDPPVMPPKEIDDPTDSKPANWVDEPLIEDMTATKPADWDENAPPTIIDETATMPEDRLPEEPKMIPDPTAEKPEEWDDEEDGDWVPDMVPNPLCEQVSGCGPWEQPVNKNPAYKGKWVRPKIENPAYKGEWHPRQIPNPDYYEDMHPADFEPLGGVGFELWTMTDDILFDNLYVGHSADDAEKLAKETYHIKHVAELAEEGDVDEDEENKLSTVDKLKLKVYQFANLAQSNPKLAITAMPETAAGLLAALFTLLGMLGALFGLIGSSNKPTIQVKKSTTVKSKVEPVAVSSETAVKPVEPASTTEAKALSAAGVEVQGQEGLTKRAGAGKSEL
ncbi:hypothetical protein QFC20_002773 [Naganishia adeliensis]|uniref:Uncharacterized protein n=1 Tax=Naganishia adeliensis TaxID=92952 RepID=A0ACC2WJJ7_9TREE|nr:hypothetical protein QFC20_002773 [Naganishia adeliensis]